MKASATATITFTFTEAPPVFSTAAFTLGTLGAISGTGTVRTAIFTAGTIDGTASVTVRAGSYTDAAGNPGTAGGTPKIVIDIVAPTVSISTSVETMTQIGETATNTFAFSELPVGFTDADITAVNGSLSPITGTDTTRAATFTVAPGLDLGSANVSVSAGSYTDAAGNPGGGGSVVMSIDCPECAATICGDGSCDRGEDCNNCSNDCCLSSCGDGSCDRGEDISCSSDCVIVDLCPNGTCDSGEDCNNCSSDCGSCTLCPNGTCDNGENCNTCSSDCGSCTLCGDGSCDRGEDSTNCSIDCGAVCPPGKICNGIVAEE